MTLQWVWQRSLTHPCESASKPVGWCLHSESLQCRTLGLCLPGVVHHQAAYLGSYQRNQWYKTYLASSSRNNQESSSLGLTPHWICWQTQYKPVQIEREDILLHFLLAHHHVKDWRNTVYCNARVSHAQDAVKLCSNEGNSRLFDGLAKYLLLYSNVSNLQLNFILISTSNRVTERLIYTFCELHEHVSKMATIGLWQKKLSILK